jgi:TonB-linked SusC/RagA family outer membrane protein
LPDLTYRISFGPDLTYSRNGQFQGPETAQRTGGTGLASYNTNSEVHYTFDNTINYKKNFNNVHKIDLTLLYSIEKNRLETSGESADQLPYDYQLFYNVGSASEVLGIGSNLNEWQLQSYMGRLNYSFVNKYLLTLTGRIDGSSRLAPGHKYGFFPSVAVGWIISDEPFMKSQKKTFSTLKLRVSYGSTGNTAIDPYQTLGSLTRTGYDFNGTSAFGYTPGTLSNKDLQWEVTHQGNVGVDFDLWNGILSGSIDYYNSNTDQLLMNRLLPSSTGFNNITSNIGKTKNVGLNVSLSTTNISRGSFKWTTDLNFSTNKNSIVELSGTGKDDVGNAWFIGHPIDVYYNYQFQGIWQSDQKDLAAKYGVTPVTIRVADQNNDEKINDADRVILGTPFPKWTAGMTNNLNFKNFGLSVFIVATQGNMINNPLLGSAFSNFGRNNELAVSYWTPTNPSNKWPRPNFDQHTPLYGETLNYMDGSFVRVKNDTLSYTLPKSILKSMTLSNARVYIQAQNLYLFTASDFIGYDPEFVSDANNPPSPRSFLFGVSIQF